MLRDIIYNLFACPSPESIWWHGILMGAIFALGLAMAYQIWYRPWRNDAFATSSSRFGDSETSLSSSQAFNKQSSSAETKRKTEPEPKSEFKAVSAPKKGPRAKPPEPVADPFGKFEEKADYDRKVQDSDLSSAEKTAAVGATAVGGAAVAALLNRDKKDEDKPTETNSTGSDEFYDETDDFPTIVIGETKPEEEEAEEPTSEGKPEKPAAFNESLVDPAPVGAGAGLAALLASDFAGQEAEVVPKLGIVYTSRPGRVDDLRRIHGVGPVIKEKLHRDGIYQFRQIAAWGPAQVSAFSERLDFQDRIERELWVSQAAELSKMADSEIAESYKAPSQVDHSHVVATFFAGDFVRTDSDLGIVYLERPDVRDELDRIDIITHEMERRLHDYGVYRFQQIANWSDHNVTQFADRLTTQKTRIEREKWIPQAQRLHRDTYSASSYWGVPAPTTDDYQERIDTAYEGLDVRPDPELGIVFYREPDEPDDLTRIQGISELAAIWLRDNGVFTFRQIADWSEANVSGFSDRLDLPAERIYAERWIAQAAELMVA